MQSQTYQPEVSVIAGKEYRLVTAKLCVEYPTNGKYAIRIVSGDLPPQSKGILTSARLLEAGDCFSSDLQLGSISGFSRYAFRARAKSILTPIQHSNSIAIVNAMRAYSHSFKGDAANLVEGLAIGVDDGLSEQFLKNMKATGLTHLTAVSGANCAIVIGAIWLIARAIRLGRNQRFALMLVSLVSYVALVGPQPSVLRAAFMMLTVAFALEFGRRAWIPGALGLGSAVLLIADPWLVADYGFWLSVLATLGLVLLTPELLRVFRARMPNFLAVGLSATIAAQIWCLPLLISLQGGFTSYSVLANLLVEPVVPIITLLGLGSTLVGVWLPPFGDILASIASVPAQWIVFVANSLSNAPAGLLALPSGAPGVIGVSAFVLATTIALIRRSIFAAIGSSLLTLLWVGSLASAVAVQGAWPISGWSVVNCDVGQGDALVIQSRGQIAVIDVGKDPELIDHCLDRLGVHRVNLLVLTHFDFDHVGGIRGLERGRSIDTALVSPYADARPEAEFLVRQLETVTAVVVKAHKGAAGTLGDFRWIVFSSLQDRAESANQASLGMRFEDSSEVIYLLADLDATAQELAKAEVYPSSKPTLVKVSHHGSADQSGEFYKTISADLALISVGKNNPYGHPTEKILNFLAATRTEVLRTDNQGAISVRVDNAGFEARVTGPR